MLREDPLQVWRRVKSMDKPYGFTPSNLDLVVPDPERGCMYSARRDVRRPEKLARDPHQQRGSFIHDCLASLINTGSVNPRSLLSKMEGVRPEQADEWYDEFVALDLPGLVRDLKIEHKDHDLRAEVGYQINLDTKEGSILGFGLDHKTARAMGQPRAITGVVDCRWKEERRDESGKCVYRKITIVDWKLSRAAHVSKRVEENLQLVCYAAMAMQAENADEVEIQVRFLDHGEHEAIPSYTFAGARKRKILRDFVEYLYQLKFAVDDAEPSPGPWCTERFCPLVGVCPKTVEAAIEISPEPDVAKPDPTKMPPLSLVLDGGAAIVSPAHFEYVLVRLAMISKCVERAREVLARWADERGGVTLSDGRIWKEYESPVEKISCKDQEALVQAMSRWIPESEARELVSVTVPKKAFQLAVKSKQMRGKKDEAAREAVAKLRAEGFTESDVTRKHEARKPRLEDRTTTERALADVCYDDDGVVVDE